MSGDRKTNSIMVQVALLFAASMMSAAVITLMTSRYHSVENVEKQTAEMAASISEEVSASIREYPAYEWLLDYWYSNYDQLEIEYDAEYGPGTVTEEKSRKLHRKYPDIMLRYAQTEEVESLPPEDQKAYAEVTYSWLLSRLNLIKRAYHIDYLFVVMTDPSFTSQFFLLSAADPGAVRGTEYEQVYPLGVTVSVAENESQQYAMRSARENTGYLADAGDYMDYYGYLCEIGNKTVLVGMTYNLTDLRESMSRQTTRDTTYTLLHQFSLALICLMLINLFVLVPLKKVQENIRLYKTTKDSATVRENLARLRVSNEIGDLAEDVSLLTTEIDDYLSRIEKITAEKERLGTELKLASRIQESMLPSDFPVFPDRKEFDIFASMNPAKEVGGDFYDFFLIDEDHLGIVIADVSGKGIPAALFMTISMVLVHSNAMRVKTAAKTLGIVNKEICANNPEEMFVSVWFGILDLRDGTLTASNAGHEYPMIKQPGGHFELLKDQHGFVIGGMMESRYQEYTVKLEPGAKLFLYTDGLPEATRNKNELFGVERALLAVRALEDGTPEEILGEVERHVEAFVGDDEQFDDLTMLCLVYHGPGELSSPSEST